MIKKGRGGGLKVIFLQSLFDLKFTNLILDLPRIINGIHTLNTTFTVLDSFKIEFDLLIPRRENFNLVDLIHYPNANYMVIIGVTIKNDISILFSDCNEYKSRYVDIRFKSIDEIFDLTFKFELIRTPDAIGIRISKDGLVKIDYNYNNIEGKPFINFDNIYIYDEYHATISNFKMYKKIII